MNIADEIDHLIMESQRELILADGFTVSERIEIERKKLHDDIEWRARRIESDIRENLAIFVDRFRIFRRPDPLMVYTTVRTIVDLLKVLYAIPGISYVECMGEGRSLHGRKYVSYLIKIRNYSSSIVIDEAIDDIQKFVEPCLVDGVKMDISRMFENEILLNLKY